MQKHYFITYEWFSIGMERWAKANAAIAEHPTKWLHKALSRVDGTKYVITFWCEITEEQYNLMREWL